MYLELGVLAFISQITLRDLESRRGGIGFCYALQFSKIEIDFANFIPSEDRAKLYFPSTVNNTLCSGTRNNFCVLQSTLPKTSTL